MSVIPTPALLLQDCNYHFFTMTNYDYFQSPYVSTAIIHEQYCHSLLAYYMYHFAYCPVATNATMELYEQCIIPSNIILPY